MCMRVLSIDGNISAGKTTLGKQLEAWGLVTFRQEPVDAWRNDGGFNLLAAYYADPHRYALTFQLKALLQRAETWQACAALPAGQPVLLERSIWSDRLFARNCFDSGYMTPLEHDIYEGVRQWVVVGLPSPSGLIYLRTPAEICIERIRRRSRPEEMSITLDYLKRLEALHDEWLNAQQGVAVIDGTDYPTYEEVVGKLREAGIDLAS